MRDEWVVREEEWSGVELKGGDREMNKGGW